MAIEIQSNEVTKPQRKAFKGKVEMGTRILWAEEETGVKNQVE